MLVEVTNNDTEITLNAVDTYTAGTVATTGVATLTATGGNRTNPLPYPFSHAVILPTESLELPMNVRDWRYIPITGLGQEPGEKWNALVQSGLVSLSFSSQSDTVDPESLAVDTI